MIEFIINGVKAVLPEGFSFKLIDENPYITQRGQFSLDITLSLKSTINARIFSHIDRLNNINIPTEMPAVIIENRKSIQGKIIDIENTNDSVTFQFVAGNSEINWFGGSKKIWDLDWGAETSIDYDKAKRSINYPGYGPKSYEVLAPGGMSYYPKRYVEWNNNYVCCPVKCKSETSDIVLNLFEYDTVFDATVSIISISNITLQPYLLFYVNKLPELLGYTLKSNILNTDTRAINMYLINTINSLNYSDALPDMTILDFINSVEKFFNVIFNFDSSTKELSIISLAEYIENTEPTELTKVVDVFERKYNSKNKINSISYPDLQDTYFFKYQKLAEDVMAKLVFMHFDDWDAIYSYFSANPIYQHLDKPIIYVDDSNGEQWIFAYPSQFSFYERSIGWSSRSLTLINKYRDYISETDGESSIELKICPACISKISAVANYLYLGLNKTATFDVQVPYSSNTRYTSETQKIIDIVENGVNSIPRLQHMEASFFVGLYPKVTDISIYYPLSCIDDRFDEGWQVNNLDPDIHITGASDFTFRIEGTNGIKEKYYSETEFIAYENEYTFKFYENNPIYANMKFLHNNSLYLAKSLEQQKSANNLKQEFTGYFYKLK